MESSRLSRHLRGVTARTVPE